MMHQNVHSPMPADPRQRLVETDASFSFLLRRLKISQPYTYGESCRAASYSYRLAAALGYGEEQAMRMYRTALLADIGLLQVAEGDAEEHVQAYLQHPLTSAALLRPLAERDKIDLVAIEQHHENLDGTGYPAGLTAKKITMNAQMVRVAGSFTVLTRYDRRTGRIEGGEKAVEEMFRWSGILFEERIIEVVQGLIR